jgi:hypothetical protein
MIDVHELEQARKDFAYIRAQKDIEEWQQWEEWKNSSGKKEAKIIVINETGNNITEVRATSEKGLRFKRNILSEND